MSSNPNSQSWHLIEASAQVALQGQTPTPLRAYSFAYDEVSQRIKLRAEVERTLTKEETEDLAVAETEVIAEFILGDNTKVETEITVVPTGEPLHPLADGIAFVRPGELVYRVNERR